MFRLDKETIISISPWFLIVTFICITPTMPGLKPATVNMVWLVSGTHPGVWSGATTTSVPFHILCCMVRVVITATLTVDHGVAHLVTVLWVTFYNNHVRVTIQVTNTGRVRGRGGGGIMGAGHTVQSRNTLAVEKK